MNENDYGVFGDVLAAAEIGSWKIEIDEGQEPRMYDDATMRRLVGIKDGVKLSPEATYHAWYDRVDAAHYDAVAEGVGCMMDGRLAEIQYPWHHPDGRVIIVRCGGIRDPKYTKGIRVVGIHQWVTTMKHVDRDLEAKERQLKESITALERANRHERFRADALAFAMHNDNIEQFVDYFSQQILEIYDCDQVIFRDIEGRTIIKEKPGTPAIDFSLCESCPHYAFNAEVYREGFTVMDDCSKGYNNIPTKEGCRVKASLTWLVYEEKKVFGYIALHYIGDTHHFSDYEKETFDSIAKFVSLVLTRRKQQKMVKKSLAFTNYFIDTFIATYSINLSTRRCTVYKRDIRPGLDHPVISDYIKAIGSYIDKNVHPDDRADLLQFIQPDNLRRLLRDQHSATTNFRDISDGVEKIYNIRVVRGADENNVAFAVANITEETEKEREHKRRLEAMNTALQEKNDRFDVLKTLIKAGQWNFKVNANDEVTASEYSDDLLRVLNVDAAMVGDEPDGWVKLLHEDDRDAALAAYRAAIVDHTGKTPYDVVYRMMDRNGNYNWFHSAGKVIRHEDGTGDFFGIHVNITATIEKEREQQKQLEDALNMAQAASRAKTMFLSNMSHDIRTPMNAIIGFTSLAASHIDSKALVKDYLAKISQSSDHLLSLINDVLDMARIESGRMNLNEKNESLPEIIHSLRNIIQSQISNKQLDFYIDCCDVKHENIVCDKLRLSQVFLNVLSNSIKYTPTGGMVSLRISELGMALDKNGNEESSVPRARYVFIFKDNGIGMSAEYLKEVFDPFSRAKNTTASGVQGTGLGMAITRNIVDMMGGDIEVKSAIGQGTEVTIIFDFALGDDMETSPRIHELEGCHALVVDDNVNSCLSEVSMLEEIGMVSEWCTSGKEAVIRARAAFEKGSAFRVYLIDWLMPDMNGLETVRRIRKIIGKDMPIVILTAYDWSDIEAEAIEAGVTAFIAKPLFASELHKVLVENLCDSKSDETASPALPLEPAAALSSPIVERKACVRHILLVEDNEINREIAVVILTEQGFEVDVAINGAEAVEKVKKVNGKGAGVEDDCFDHPYDLVLMDIQMPVMNGYQATKAIREWEQTEAGRSEYGKLPIVALSANAFAEDIAASLEIGMNDHLSKPIKVKELVACINKFGIKR